MCYYVRMIPNTKRLFTFYCLAGKQAYTINQNVIKNRNMGYCNFKVAGGTVFV